MLRRAQTGYYAYLSFIDEQVGRLLQGMESMKLLDNTLIVIAADHGEMLGDHHLWQKCCAFEGAANVPFIVRAPVSWSAPANRIAPQVVGLQDIMPTLLDAAGAEIPNTVSGHSLLPILKGEPSPAWREYYHGCLGPNYAPDNAMHYVTDGNWKFIWNPISDERHFFDLQTDRRETNDRVNDPSVSREREKWEGFLVRELAGQPEGLSDGQKLIPGHMPFFRGAPRDRWMPFNRMY
jgi:arylsulfatase A-like enzyme